MPQAVSLFPSAPPQPPRASSSQSSSDNGSSSFSDVLNSAQVPDTSSQPTAQSQRQTKSSTHSSSSTSSTDKSSNTPKAKPSKTTPTKGKLSQSRPKAQDDSTEVESAEDSDARQEEAAITAQKQADAHAAETSTSSKPKSQRPAAHGGDAGTAAPSLVGRPDAQPIQPLAIKDQDSQESTDDAADQPSKGLAAVKAIGDPGDGDDASDADDAQLASADAATDAKPVAQGNGKTISKGSKASKASASEGDEEVATAAGAKPGGTVDGAANSAEGSDVDVPETANSGAGAPSVSGSHATTQSFADALLSAQGQTPNSSKLQTAAVHAAPPTPPLPPETQFAESNHAQIVTGIQGQLLPNGGSMQMHLNPGELGSMSVSVHMRDGIMTATFATANDQAAKLLSHSLGQLKTALEGQGVSVGRLHVEQAPKSSQTNSQGEGGKNSQSGAEDKSAQQQEQQRREMIRKMWRRLNGGKDPLDMVA